MIKLAERDQCTGCGGCAAVCKAGCIHMAADDRGFPVPVVEEEGCIDCGMCMQTCPVDKGKGNPVPDAAYAARVTDEGLLMKSSSGGVFGALAREALGRGGLVVGAAFAGDFTLRHQTAETEEQLEALLCSKYVQSDAVRGMEAAIVAAKAGRPVLFTGTPCQVNAVGRALGRRDNLLLADVACHGVPSQRLWRKYVKELETAKGGKLMDFTFRNKADGWQNYCLRGAFEGGGVYQSPPASDPYMKLFLQDLSLRQSCYSCVSKENPMSDLTLADFWGVKSHVPGFDYQKGASLVLVRTDKGRGALDGIAASLNLAQVAVAGVEKANPAIYHSAAENPAREAFFSDLDTLTVAQLAAKYTKSPSLISKVKNRLKRLI